VLASGRRAPARLSRLGATQERFSRLYRDRYRKGVGAAPSLAGLGDREREAFRVHGRALVGALLRHLDADDEPARESALREAESTALELGRQTMRLGASLTASVALFTAARSPFLEEIGAIGRRRALSPAELSHLYDVASAALDHLLVVFIGAHQAGLASRPADREK
jgi:hypothetical protein